ncbi:MAG: hypothetical protein EOP85_02135, partial [Verrucomicrobiaceae bacterium]
KLDAGDGAAAYSYSIARHGDWMAMGFESSRSNQGCVYLFMREGGQWKRNSKLTATSPATDDLFGKSVAMSSDTLVIGSPGEDDNGTNVGKIYIYTRSGTAWNLTVAHNGIFEEPQSGMGTSVAIEGNMIVAGAPGTSTSTGVAGGRVHVFEKGASWTRTKALSATGIAVGDMHGWSVAISGGVIVAGAPGDDSMAFNAGCVYVHQKVGSLWGETKLLASDNSIGNYFGECVGISGSTIAVGAANWDFSANATNTGAIYIFGPGGGGWVQQRRLHHSNPEVGDYFGGRFSLSGDKLVAAVYRGSVPVFVKDSGGTWIQSADLYPSLAMTAPPLSALVLGNEIVVTSFGLASMLRLDGGSWQPAEPVRLGNAGLGSRFGNSVAVEGNLAAIGMTTISVSGTTQGGVCILLERTGSTWKPKGSGQLVPGTSETSGRFGCAVDISNGSVAVGACHEEGRRGGAYVFDPAVGGGYIRTRLTNTSGAQHDAFGYSLSLHEGRLVVGSPGATVSGMGEAGIAMVFDRSAAGIWSFNNLLQAQAIGSFWSVVSDASESSHFGYSVAVLGNRIVIGAPLADATGPARQDVGKVYVYSYTANSNTWSPTIPLTPDPGDTGGWFGCSVSLNADYIVIGASGGSYDLWTYPIVGDRKGKVFIFGQGYIFWELRAEIQASPASVAPDNFGHSVAIDDRNRIIVGAPQSGASSGKAYLYHGSGSSWTQDQMIAPDAGTGVFRFGYSVAIDGDTLVCGAPDSTTLAAPQAGTAFIYRITDPAAIIPQLTISRSGVNAILSWPATAGWSLYRSPSLESGSWVPVTVTADGSYNYPMSGTTRMFFRLQRP